MDKRHTKAFTFLEQTKKILRSNLADRNSQWSPIQHCYTPIKFKAPKTINDQVFPTNINLKMLRQSWGAERRELNRLLDHLDPTIVNKEIYKKPFGGRLTIGEMLNFFQFHQNPHQHHITKEYCGG